MDAAEKRRLKKLGKQQVEQQSRELRERLAESNPAPVGSDAWAKNYRQATLKEKELRQQQPDLIHARELDRDFVTNPASSPWCAHVLHRVPSLSGRPSLLPEGRDNMFVQDALTYTNG